MVLRAEEINQEQAEAIIFNRLPLGIFYLREGNKYVGIDNQSGDAWTEEFETESACKKWLEG